MVQKLTTASLVIFFKFFLLLLIPSFAQGDEIQNWDESIENTKKESFRVETFIDGFDIPWGMVFLPNKNKIEL